MNIKFTGAKFPSKLDASAPHASAALTLVNQQNCSLLPIVLRRGTIHLQTEPLLSWIPILSYPISCHVMFTTVFQLSVDDRSARGPDPQCESSPSLIHQMDSGHRQSTLYIESWFEGHMAHVFSFELAIYIKSAPLRGIRIVG